MKKVIGVIIPVLIILIFVVFLNSGEVLKKPLTKEEDVEFYLIKIKGYINNGKWSEAEKHFINLEKAWKTVSTRIQFISEKTDFTDFSNSLARLKGAIMEKDRKSSLIEIEELKSIWKNFTN